MKEELKEKKKRKRNSNNQYKNVILNKIYRHENIKMLINHFFGGSY